MRPQAEPSWRWPERKMMSQILFNFTQPYPLKQFDELMRPRGQLLRTVSFELRLNLILLLGTASQSTSMCSNGHIFF